MPPSIRNIRALGRARMTGVAALAACAGAVALGPLAGPADAATNASSAASFIENAQNADGGFGAHEHGASDPQASLWATTALLAAGKNPQAEALNHGSSADDYLAAHLSSYASLQDLGLLAIIQAGSGVPDARYGDPAEGLEHDLTPAAVRGDPGGAALGVLGLVALNTSATRSAARAAGQELLGDALKDGGWGSRLSDSASTALVLEALAASGTASASDAAVTAGLAYLHQAQVNDGSIATSDRTDPSSTGDVAATAFTVQAQQALHVPSLKTSTGTTVLQGLASYQQQGTGGLSSFGAYDTGVAASVLQTAQAYPAFDGVAFPLPYVPYAPPPPTPPKVTTTPAPTAANRVSAGTASSGVSSSAPSTHRKVSAFKGASAAGSKTATKRGHGSAGSGSTVNGQVVGAAPAPKLATRSGRAPGIDWSGPLLALGLLALAILGGLMDFRRPRTDHRSGTAIAVQRAYDLGLRARARGALQPAAVVAVALGLVAIPVATGMWSRAPQGARMISAFAPYMRTARLDRLQGDVARIDGAVRQASKTGAALQFPGLSSPARAKRFASADPQLETFSRQWPAIHRRFRSLLDPMQANRDNYAAVAALPSFSAFPWFLLVPGVVLAALAMVALWIPRLWSRIRWAVLATGVLLILAPLALGMFSRAPKGADLVSAFRPIETRGNLTAIQNDFASLAVGDGAFTSELEPALKRRGLSDADQAHRLPAVHTFEHDFVGILGDLTPVLGVMSDNITTFQAVAALPSFVIFPWLFALPGLLACACVLGPGLQRRARLRRPMWLSTHPADITTTGES